MAKKSPSIEKTNNVRLTVDFPIGATERAALKSRGITTVEGTRAFLTEMITSAWNEFKSPFRGEFIDDEVAAMEKHLAKIKAERDDLPLVE